MTAHRHTTLETAFQMPEPYTADIVHKERCRILLHLRRDFAAIEDEPTAYHYYDGQGRHRIFKFDWVFVTKDQKRIAVVAELLDRAEGVRAAIFGAKQWNGRADNEKFDDFLLITEVDIMPIQYEIIDRIRWSQDDKDLSPETKVREIIATLQGTTTVGELIAASGHQGQAYRAICRLIGTRELLLMSEGQIEYPTFVCRPE